MPANSVYVGRPTIYGNPFKVGIDGTLEECLEKYERMLSAWVERDPTALDPLKGKDLACWCPLEKRCHVDILLKYLYGQED